MVLILPELLGTEELRQIQAQLQDAPWESGVHSAGEQARQVKHNEQLPHHCEQAKNVRMLVLRALERSNEFFAAALPKKIFTPRVNRYEGGEASSGKGAQFYGPHVDNSLRIMGPERYVRTDLSCTLFLNDPDSYQGGELCIANGAETQSIKLNAGDAVLYPSGRLHEVKPVTAGARLACFFWVESLIRSDEQRRILHDLDQNLLRLRHSLGERSEIVALTGVYHQLMRLWADT